MVAACSGESPLTLASPGYTMTSMRQGQRQVMRVAKSAMRMVMKENWVCRLQLPCNKPFSYPGFVAPSMTLRSIFTPHVDLSSNTNATSPCRMHTVASAYYHD